MLATCKDRALPYGRASAPIIDQLNEFLRHHPNRSPLKKLLGAWRVPDEIVAFGDDDNKVQGANEGGIKCVTILAHHPA